MQAKEYDQQKPRKDFSTWIFPEDQTPKEIQDEKRESQVRKTINKESKVTFVIKQTMPERKTPKEESPKQVANSGWSRGKGKEMKVETNKAKQRKPSKKHFYKRRERIWERKRG